MRSGALPAEMWRSSPSLVGEGRVVVPIGDDDLARVERRRDHLADELAARGHEEVHLSLSVQDQPRVEDDLANALPQLSPTWLTDDHRVVRAEPLAQHLDLGRLAGPLGTLEGDE